MPIIPNIMSTESEHPSGVEPSQPEKAKKFSYNLYPRTIRSLTHIVEVTHLTQTAVIQDSLSLAELVLDATVDGGELVVRGKDGTEKSIIILDFLPPTKGKH